jgi:hypothetical protein
MNNTESTTTTKATAATQGTQDAPKPATATKVARTSKGAPRGKKGARKPATTKAAKPAAKKTVKSAPRNASNKAMGTGSVPREFSKKQIVLDLLRRKDGATMGEIAKATGWQNHSIRGFISGTVSKRMGLNAESAKNDAGERTYRIAGK